MKKITHIALATAALGVAMDASANVPTHSYSVQSNKVAFTKSGSGVLDLTKFNTSLGTLQSVQVQLFSDFATTIKAENTSKNSASTITATATATLTLTGLSQVLNVGGTQVFNEAKWDGLTNFAGASGVTFTFSGPATSSSTLYTDAATKSLFSSGPVHLALTGSTGIHDGLKGTSGNTAGGILPNFDSYAVVTYNYVATPVPEPETYAMLLAGLGLVGAIARKRKAK